MKFSYAFIFSMVTFFSYSQSNIRFSHLNFAQGVNNPASIAYDAKIMVDLIGRNQWAGFDGAPTTIALNGQYEIDGDMAVGLNVFHDRIGVNQTTAVSAQYAYRMYTVAGHIFSLGLGAGIDNHIIDYASAQTTTVNDPAFQNTYSRVIFQASLGAYYYAPRFYFGVSAPEIFKPNFDPSGKAKLSPEAHYYLSTGFYLGSGRYVFNPNIQVKALRNAPIAGDIVLRNTFNGRFSFSVGYRTENSIIAGIDMLITPMMRAGYSFNYDVGPLSRAKGMSNELYLGFAFPYRDDRSDFDKRRYISTKGGFKRTYRKRQNRNRKTRFNR